MNSAVNQPRLLLASASPRRAELLRQIDVRFETVPADVDETAKTGESAEHLVVRLAVAKARVVARACPDAIVLGADTVVALDDRIFGKPNDAADAVRMLSALSDHTHRVCSGLAVIHDGQCETRLSVSRVTFAQLDDAAMVDYWASGEPRGKAGAYAIQGLGGAFVTHLEGSYSGVMGLPLHDVAVLLKGAGITLAAFPRA